MKKNFKCYGCVYCKSCDKELEEKCASYDYVLFCTKEERELCDIMCPQIEEEKENDDVSN